MLFWLKIKKKVAKVDIVMKMLQDVEKPSVFSYTQQF